MSYLNSLTIRELLKAAELGISISFYMLRHNVYVIGGVKIVLDKKIQYKVGLNLVEILNSTDPDYQISYEIKKLITQIEADAAKVITTELSHQQSQRTSEAPPSDLVSDS